MKKLFYNIVLTIIVIFSTVSCDNFIDVHEEFIQGGERIYAPIVDSVNVFGGNNRVILKIRYFNGNNLDKTVIYWNDYLDSIVVALSSYNITKGLDSIEVNIPNLKENSYSFNIINYDKFGNKSLSVPAFGNSYGALYQASINNRNIREKFNSGNHFIIRWSAAPDKLVHTEVKFLNESNQEVVVTKGRGEEYSYPKSINNSFVYRSAYLPEENAVDIFYTDWSTALSL